MKIDTAASFVLEEMEAAFISAQEERISASDASVLATIAFDRVYNPKTPRYLIRGNEIIDPEAEG